MLFKNKGKDIDFIVSFRISSDDISSIYKNSFLKLKPGIYYNGKNSTIDKIVFNREKGAVLDIQRSQFKPDRQHMILFDVWNMDPQPHLFENKHPSSGHSVHYRMDFASGVIDAVPDTAEYITTIFNIAKDVEIFEAKHCDKNGHPNYYAVAPIKGDIRKYEDGHYGIDLSSIRPVKWKIEQGMFEKQRLATNKAKKYFKENPHMLKCYDHYGENISEYMDKINKKEEKNAEVDVFNHNF